MYSVWHKYLFILLFKFWNLIYKDECMFVCTLYKSTFLNRSEPNFAHISPVVWKRPRVCMGPQYFTFPTFSTYFVGSGCRFLGSRWLPAPHCTATALYPWRGAYWCDVTHGVLCNESAEKLTECVWKWKPDETGWKWLMNWTCNCIAVIQLITYNLSNLRPSFFRSLSMDNTFFHLLKLSRRSSDTFR